MESKFMSGMAFAILAGVGIAVPSLTLAEDSPRNLKWAYAGEAFEAPANWTWAAEPAGDITTGPGEKDAVRFWGLATANAGAENTVRLAADVTVSNFNYNVQRASGKLVVDLGGKALTVSGNMNLVTDRNYLNTDGITFKDGTVRVTGSATGTANQWSQKNEDYGGFYVNLPGNSYAGLNCTLDNAVLDITSRQIPMVAYHSTGGDLGSSGAFCRTNHFTLVNGSEIRANRFTFNVQCANAPTHAIVDVKNSKMTIYDETKTSDQTFNMLTCQGGGSLDMLFREGGSLEAGEIHARGDMSFLFDGGNHVLHGALNWGDNGALRLDGGLVAVANAATLELRGNVKIQNGAQFSVLAGGRAVCETENTDFSVGAKYGSTDNKVGRCMVLVDGGTLKFPLVTIGSSGEDYADNILKLVGPLSRVEQTQGTLWGSPSGMAFNYGTKVAFEIPAGGYHDADGVARAPVYTAGAFRSTTTESCRPIGLALATRTFDRANPKASVTLLQAASDSRAVLDQLRANVVWTDNPADHGELSVSADGRALVYTAPARRGLVVTVR